MSSEHSGPDGALFSSWLFTYSAGRFLIGSDEDSFSRARLYLVELVAELSVDFAFCRGDRVGDVTDRARALFFLRLAARVKTPARWLMKGVVWGSFLLL